MWTLPAKDPHQGQSRRIGCRRAKLMVYAFAAFAIAPAGLTSAPAQARRNALPVRMQRTLENELQNAFRSGDPQTVLTLCLDMVEKVNPGRWPAIDARLDELKMPGLGALVLSSRLELRSSDPHANVQPVQPRELQLVVPELEANLKQIADDVDAAARTQAGSLRETGFDDFEARLWRLHVLRNQLQNTATLIDYGKELAGTRAGRAVQRADQSADTTSLSASLATLVQQADRLGRRIDDRSVEVRLDRLDHALSRLKSADVSLVEQIKSAWAGDIDGYALDVYFRENDDPQARVSPRLHSPTIAAESRNRIDELRSLVGDALLTKSRHLYTGLHWWLRGRYGMGPSGFGMLKPPVALKDPQRMFGLYMPTETPLPTPPGELDSVPEIDRRHHYGWMFEYRRLFRMLSSSKKTRSRTSVRATSRTRLSRFY